MHWVHLKNKIYKDPLLEKGILQCTPCPCTKSEYEHFLPSAYNDIRLADWYEHFLPSAYNDIRLADWYENV